MNLLLNSVVACTLGYWTDTALLRSFFRVAVDFLVARLPGIRSIHRVFVHAEGDRNQHNIVNLEVRVFRVSRYVVRETEVLFLSAAST